MNIFVTGGAGYVGSFCVRELCRTGHAVTVYDNLRNGHRRAVDARAKLIVADLADAARLNSAFQESRPEAVMHFAALAEVAQSVAEPLLYYRNNVSNTIILLDAMRAHGVRKLIFSSSCAVFGVPSAVPITEDMPTNPISPYGRTKLAIEWALRDSVAAWGLSATALRYFNAAGAASDGSMGEDHRPESHLIPIVLQVALGRRESLEIFGDDFPTPDGTCIRDYVHVEDLAVIHRLTVESQVEGEFRFYNVGTGVGSSVQAVVETARRITERSILTKMAPRRRGDPPILYADPTKIRTAFDWQPRYPSIDMIIKTAWAWARRHPEGYG